MSFAVVNNAVNGTGNETSQSSTPWTVGTTSNAGELLVLVIAFDNISTTDGQTSNVTNVTDSKGNTWNKVGELTNTVGGAAGDGAAVALWYSVLTTQLVATTDSITTFYSGSIVCKSVIVRRFTIGAGNTVSTAGTLQTEAVDNGDVGALALSGLTSKEYLFFRAIGSETDGNNTGNTATASYTILGARSGTGGSEKGHISEINEFRILTATGSTSNPTLADTTSDNASLFIAFQEVAVGSTSPSLSPSISPSVSPSPSRSPSISPSVSPSPSLSPSISPSISPSVSPSPSLSPSISPSLSPSVSPSVSPSPSLSPSLSPSVSPSVSPSTPPTNLSSFFLVF